MIGKVGAVAQGTRAGKVDQTSPFEWKALPLSESCSAHIMYILYTYQIYYNTCIRCIYIYRAGKRYLAALDKYFFDHP